PNGFGMARWHAIHALVSLGEVGLEPLLSAPWGDQRANIHPVVLQALGTYSARSPTALRFLLKNLGSGHAVQALAQGKYGDDAKEAVPELTNQLKSGDAFQRHWALEALFAVGPTGPPAAARFLEKADAKLRAAILTKLKSTEYRIKDT